MRFLLKENKASVIAQSIGKITYEEIRHLNNLTECNGCGSVGRAVTSNTRSLRFQSSHRQTFNHLYTVKCIERAKIKPKRAGMSHLKNLAEQTLPDDTKCVLINARRYVPTRRRSE